MKNNDFYKIKKYQSEQSASMARIIAKIIDFGFALIFAIMLYPFGVIFAVFYLAIADSLMEGESIGKKCMGFRVVSLVDGTPCGYKDSCLRNLPFVIPFSLLIFPIWGWFAAFLTFLPAALVEFYLIYKSEHFLRVGDMMAQTTVVASDPDGEEVKRKSRGWFDPTEDSLEPQSRRIKE